MRNISFKHSVLVRTLAVAGLVSLLALGGCSGSGSLTVGDDRGTPSAGNGGTDGTGGGGTGGTGGGGGGGGGGTDVSATSNLNSLARVSRNTGDSGSSLGNSIAALGDTLNTILPDAGMRLDQTVGGIFVNTGQAVDSIGDGITAGLGQLGTAKDPINATLHGLPGAVVNVGEVVSTIGNPALIGQPLAALQPVTTPVLNLVNQVGVGVSSAGTALGGQLNSDGVRQVTGGLSEAIVPLASAVLSTTQQVGDATGVGAPVNNLLVNVGGAVHNLGQSLGNSSGAPVGEIVSYTGNTVAALGGVVDFKQDGGGVAGGLLAPVTNLLGGLGNGTGTGGTGGLNGGLLAPVTGLVSGITGGLSGGGLPGTGSTGGVGAVLAPVTSVLGSLGSGAGTGGTGGASGVLAPVTNLVGGVTGSLTGGTGGANNLLAPVTNLLGGLGGGLKK